MQTEIKATRNFYNFYGSQGTFLERKNVTKAAAATYAKKHGLTFKPVEGANIVKAPATRAPALSPRFGFPMGAGRSLAEVEASRKPEQPALYCSNCGNRTEFSELGSFEYRCLVCGDRVETDE
jgi:hypothetical protein